MIVCDSHRFVLVLPPKTGSTSMRRFITDRFECRIDDNQQHDYRIDEAPDDYLHAITVRNPFPRAVSHWWHFKTWTPEPGETWPTENRREQYEAITPLSFAEFLRHPLRKPILQPCFTWENRMRRVDAVLRFEWLISLSGFPRDNVARNGGYGDWREHYTPACVAEIRARYRDDFRMYGYSRALPR